MSRQKLMIDLLSLHTNMKNQNELKNKENQINNTISEEPKNSICGYYNKDISNDMRCCGICYNCNNNLYKEKQCNFCPNTFHEYYTSGYVITKSGIIKSDDPCEDPLCTIICFPLKFPVFFTCCLGSIFNNMINYCRNTKANYLC